MISKEITFIIQARLGSSRLPNKIVLPYYNDKTILETIINKLKSNFSNKIIVATTINQNDDLIEQISKKHNVECYRGSENNVLERFIECAKYFNIKYLIRICSDNPFLDVNEINRLINYEKILEHDYVSFLVNDKPSILTHYGFWTEFVKVEALQKVSLLTNELKYLEHVTNFIYLNRKIFKVNFLDTNFNFNEKIRLTVDTIEDFELSRKVYSDLQNTYGNNYGIKEILEYFNNNEFYYNFMQKEIIKNSK